jgi:hypothetical protein
MNKQTMKKINPPTQIRRSLPKACRKNTQRAKRAFAVLEYYKSRLLAVFGEPNTEDTLVDLFTDLRHLCAKLPDGETTFQTADEISLNLFTAELNVTLPLPPPRVPSKSAYTTTRLLNPPPK